MRELIVKVHTGVWLVAFFLPLIIYFKIWRDADPLVTMILTIIPLLVAAIWTFSIAEYMCHEAKSKKYLWLIYALYLIGLQIQVIGIPGFMTGWGLDPVLKYSKLLIMIVIAVLMTGKIKKVFYERSTWFIFLEFLVVPIGIYTLTSEIKKWEKGGKFT